MKRNFLVGMDISSFPSLIEQGLTVLGTKEEFLKRIKEKGVNSVRLRLFVDPSDEEGNLYGGGNNDLLKTIEFAKTIKNMDLNFVLDLHYSDFWADPGKQFKPKAWKDLSFPALVACVYDYTKEVLSILKANGITVDLVQTGNEITNGFLWPEGKLYEDDNAIKGGFKRLITLLKSAGKAVRDVFPEAQIIIHLDRGGDSELYHSYFSKLEEARLDYDIIGLSYYPYWHGTLLDLEKNLTYLKATYNKKIMIMETSYAYKETIDHAPLVINQNTPRKDNWPPYPFSKEGQKAFLKDLLTLLLRLNIDGFYYWEPAWLFLKGDTWATKEGRIYINETHKGDGNEWANQALFDEDGKANPALDIFKE
jgi:arabinogalactan endo-1,4-beta-galactosidase